MIDQQFFARIALSAMATSLLLTGCSVGSGKQASGVASARDGDARAQRTPTLDRLEAAVAADPDDARARVALGQGYAGAGRMTAARQAFADAVALGDTGTRAVIGLALGEIATGRPEAAIALIEAHRETLPASDAGLALALAGDTQRAVLVLGDVARNPDAGPRERQNLAFAMALDGQWAHAKLIAAQDLTPEALRARMVEWSRVAGPDAGPARVASVLGLKAVVGDAMPARLALAGDRPAMPVARTAMVDPAPLRLYAPPPPPEMVADERVGYDASAPVRVAAAIVDEAAPVARAVETIAAPGASYRMRPATPATPERLIVARMNIAPPRPAAATPAPPRTAGVGAPAVAAFDPARPRGWAIQVGAYDSIPIARSGWMRVKARHPQLAAYPASSHAVRVGNRTFHRLTINGFDARGPAQAQCRAMVARGGACFVRAMSGAETIRWASAVPVKAKSRPARLASR